MIALIKFNRYQRAGVASYWMIDPDELRLTAYELKHGEYAIAADVTRSQSWTASQPFAVTISPGELLD